MTAVFRLKRVKLVGEYKKCLSFMQSIFVCIDRYFHFSRKNGYKLKAKVKMEWETEIFTIFLYEIISRTVMAELIEHFYCLSISVFCKKQILSINSIIFCEKSQVSFGIINTNSVKGVCI